MERDTDLLKIQILADYYHARFNLVGSFIVGFVIALTVALYTLVMQNIIDMLVYSITLLFVYIMIMVSLAYVFRAYHGYLERIDELIQSINKDRFEPLPSIHELRIGKPSVRRKAEQQGISARHRIRNGLITYVTCVLIAMIIYVVVVIEDYYEKVIVANPDFWFKLVFGSLAILLFGLVLFLLVSFSPQLRRLLFRMFGAEEESRG